ncbi:hypothetical protein QTP70_008952 [Hemibagrus guttatus]|uniref:ribonuclease H n=1 Tax=Hemibagrus guttatus TaxID=175788 RepID=A0AAE0Q0D0_9TELE|nr:hypothetical protein QTP70_008952 [Hemibagrus guttatus]
MENNIEEALAAGFIQPSTSSAAAGFFFVKKKDGGLRPCIDYRGLNAITVKYPYPLPLVPPAVEQFRKAKIFMKLDLRSAYNLVRIRKGHEWKTAFLTPRGHYEYPVMPYGLTNAPAVFQSFLNEVFQDLLYKCVIVYIEDILIYSRCLKTHIHHVRTVLSRLLEHRLYVIAEKCEFHCESIKFLGKRIILAMVAVDPGNTSFAILHICAIRYGMTYHRTAMGHIISTACTKHCSSTCPGRLAGVYMALSIGFQSRPPVPLPF